MNTPVSFEIAKLLKEKECDIRVRHYYGSSVNPHIPYAKDDYEIPINYNNPTNSGTIKQLISAPTIAEVVMWLYEKYVIWISSTPVGKKFRYEIIPMEKQEKFEYSSFEFNSPTEAYSQAIEYTLKNLI